MCLAVVRTGIGCSRHLHSLRIHTEQIGGCLVFIGVVTAILVGDGSLDGSLAAGLDRHLTRCGVDGGRILIQGRVTDDAVARNGQFIDKGLIAVGLVDAGRGITDGAGRLVDGDCNRSSFCRLVVVVIACSLVIDSVFLGLSSCRDVGTVGTVCSQLIQHGACIALTGNNQLLGLACIGQVLLGCRGLSHRSRTFTDGHGDTGLFRGIVVVVACVFIIDRICLGVSSRWDVGTVGSVGSQLVLHVAGGTFAGIDQSQCLACIGQVLLGCRGLGHHCRTFRHSQGVGGILGVVVIVSFERGCDGDGLCAGCHRCNITRCFISLSHIFI